MTPIKRVAGWVLCSYEDEIRMDNKKPKREHYICWHELFTTHAQAEKFARDNKWHKPWSVRRGQLALR